jgi:hypothetical protein
VSGRANDGGLRIGEMERDGLIAHGAANMLTESMMERSDKYHMAICNKTGLIAVYNPDKNLFLSPMADGPLKFVGSLAENTMAVENVSRHGRDFSVVRVPYSLKLLIQELQCANVVMRIITDDNIDQIENMAFSKNINILLDKSGEIDAKEFTQAIQQKERKIAKLPVHADEPESPEFNPNTPESPVFNPNTPEFNPNTPDQNTQESPEYAENPSPQYPSPEYAPEDYKLGQYVALRKGGGEAWSIRNVGDEFLTIEQASGDVKVVDRNEIQPYEEYQAPALAPSPTPFMPQMPPSVNIVLVNGNNNDLKEEGKKKEEPILQKEPEKEPEKQPEKQQEPEKPKEEEKTEGGSGSGFFDFTNFIIKKQP